MGRPIGVFPFLVCHVKNVAVPNYLELIFPLFNCTGWYIMVQPLTDGEDCFNLSRLLSLDAQRQRLWKQSTD